MSPAVSRSDIVTVINELIRRGKRAAAADLRRFSRTFLEWTIEVGLAPFNELAGLSAPSRTRHQRLLQAADRGKALTDAELVKVRRAAQGLQDRAARGEPIAGTFGGLVQLALLTGMRRVELASCGATATILTGDRG